MKAKLITSDGKAATLENIVSYNSDKGVLYHNDYTQDLPKKIPYKVNYHRFIVKGYDYARAFRNSCGIDSCIVRDKLDDNNQYICFADRFDVKIKVTLIN